jgi:hypothetical protein
MVHIHSASIDVHCRKSSNVKSFSKKSYENNKFQVYMYWKKILALFACQNKSAIQQCFSLTINQHQPLLQLAEQGHLSSSAHAHEFCYFLVNFCRLGLNLNFYDNVYLQMHCGCASFQKKKLLGMFFHGDMD